MPKPEQELVHQPQVKKEKPKEIPPELINFPESIQDLFTQLPADLKTKIFSKESQGESQSNQSEFIKKGLFWKTPEEELDETIASLDKKDCEKYIQTCLFELVFNNPEFQHFFKDDTAQNIAPKITTFLETLWSNRGKDKSKIQIVNQARFDDYRNRKASLQLEHQVLIKKIKGQETSIEQTKHQKRLTEKKRHELFQLHDQQKELEKKFDKLDSEFNNNIFSTSIRLRESKERKWTEALSTALEYLDASDFSILASEMLERQIFYQEKSLARRTPRIHQQFRPEAIIDAKKLIAQFDQAFENWQQQHQKEGPLKKFQPVNLAEKQDKLINYFKALAGSYERMKKEGRTEDDQLMNIRQMEVTLNLLNKSEK